MTEIFFDSLYLLFLVGSVAAIIVGSVLFFRPDVIQRINRSLNKWYSLRRITRPYAIIRGTGEFFFNLHIGWIWVLFLGALYALYTFIFIFPPDPFWDLQYFTPRAQLVINFSYPAIRTFFITFLVLAVLFLVLRIVSLEWSKKVAGVFDRWVSTRMMLKPLTEKHYGLEAFILRHHQIFGFIFTAGAIFILITLLIAF
ncbi:MAG: hypothetical protein ACE5D2_07735 [Fidelibacterota bacterium]